MRTYSPVRLVRKSSRPYWLSSLVRKEFGSFSRPLESMVAGAFPLNTIVLLHFRPQKSTAIVGEAQRDVNVQNPTHQLVAPNFRPFIALLSVGSDDTPTRL